MVPQTLYIIYNADATVLGKLRYAYRKLRSPPNAESACAACDITHGGLSLKETPGWADTKKDLESSLSLKIVQWHRDELSKPLQGYVQEKSVKLPAVIAASGDQDQESYETVMERAGLNDCHGDPKKLSEELKKKFASSSAAEDSAKL